MFNLKEIISSIADVGQKLFKKSVVKKNDLESIISLCDDLISNKGAAFGITVARDITDLYQTLSPEKKLLFFKKINEKFKPNHTKVSEAIDLYKAEQNDKNLFKLFTTSEGQRRDRSCRCRPHHRHLCPRRPRQGSPRTPCRRFARTRRLRAARA